MVWGRAGHLVVQLQLALHDVLRDRHHAGAELDVRAAAGHVRGDRHRAGLAGEHHDLRLARGVLRVQHLMGDLRHLEEAREDLGRVHRHRAEQDRLAGLVAAADLLDDGLVLLALRAVDLVVAVDAADGAVGGDHHHVELVDVLELARLGLGRARHAGELLVEAEVVLDRDPAT